MSINTVEISQTSIFFQKTSTFFKKSVGRTTEYYIDIKKATLKRVANIIGDYYAL